MDHGSWIMDHASWALRLVSDYPYFSLISDWFLSPESLFLDFPRRRHFLRPAIRHQSFTPRTLKPINNRTEKYGYSYHTVLLETLKLRTVA
jgi:hypothetical protein